MLRLGVVSFLNSRPLIEGLGEEAGVCCTFDVPARLPALLDQGAVDAALVPLVDVLRRPGHFRVVSDACIASDGETMTVRVFARVPPDRVRTLWADTHSHTSVILADLLWRELFGRCLELRPLEHCAGLPAEAEAVLLIGDKVVDPARASFGYEVDLGGAWRQHTGWPFVFAVWVCRAERAAQRPAEQEHLARLLAAARDRGVARADEIARVHGLQLGWPVELARRYLTRCLCFTLTARAVAGAEHFARRAAAAGLVPAEAMIPWPEGVVRGTAEAVP